ncbi:cytochrome c-type protein NapC [Nitrosomonas sp. PY1]|uniref:NapC/NirT family cytochrome c n=1 Tax=Nitrosomonas sp. PY1 TaxID=1803906 RepID=UPI001FC82942|nr:NapC/NirT family cytochrome c [Nitrosomonas sp. PY1]GKS69380.1 cytochrome c-type protein NapC [Nitrosomonas sp. PY1]
MTGLQKGAIGTLLTGGLLGIVLVAVVFGGEAALSTEEFCTSCHSMTYTQKELKDSTHYGALGVNPGCKDCHIPQGFKNFHLALYTHAVDGARELYLELVNDYSTLEKFNERRLIMAHDARMNLKKWDSVTCRDCHRDPNPPGADAQEAHKKLKTEGATCIDCHQNLVHEEVAKTDLNASLAAGKMVLAKEEEGSEGEEEEDDEEEESESEESSDSSTGDAESSDDDSDDEDDSDKDQEEDEDDNGFSEPIKK